jgi:hypothetical protein
MTYEMTVQKQEIDETSQNNRLFLPPCGCLVNDVVTPHATRLVQMLESRIDLPRGSLDRR